MPASRRRKEIIDLVKTQNRITCLDLSEYFHVTPETIRRDLSYLQEQGLLVRTHGGAMANKSSLQSTELQAYEHFEQKQAIARIAASLLESDDVIYMDAGTTTNLICDYIPADLKLFVITNSEGCIRKLIDKPNVTVICTGGVLRRTTMAFAGSAAQNALASYTFNKAFISALAVSTKIGIMDSNSDDAEMNKLAVDKALKSYVVADSSKFDKVAYTIVCPLDKIHVVISDAGLAPQFRQDLARLHIETVIAD